MCGSFPIAKHKKAALKPERLFYLCQNGVGGLALTCFETRLRLVDDVNAALTAHNTAIAVTLLERAE